MERKFSTDEILQGLRALGEIEVPLQEPCTHRYRNLFPQMAQESIQAQQEGDVAYEEFSQKYRAVFEEIATCHPCTEEYLLDVVKATPSQ